MQFMLMYHEPAVEFAKRDDPAQAPAYWGAWNAYIGAISTICASLYAPPSRR